MAREPLAIVGIGCRFPRDITSPGSYWAHVRDGFDAIVPVPPERWDSKLHYSSDPDAPGKVIFDAGGFLAWDFELFDARFFGIAAREAAQLDPQQRLLLETTWECFEDAAIDPSTLAKSQTGVFVGVFTLDQAHLQQNLYNAERLGPSSATALTATMLSARLSYQFDLRGPSVAIDTACSASLVAFHQACQSIWSEECDQALAAGVNFMLEPIAGVTPSKGRFLSKDSRCFTFDARANGYGRGEGAGVVLLKPLAAAVAAGDRIYAVVRATGVNHDGRTAGVSVPNGEAQVALLRQVHGEIGFPPVQYIEAHGTGTAVGDPIEVEALSEGLKLSPDRPAYVGSVKANMGHLEAAAGIAGLIKVALALHHREIPPQRLTGQLNPKIAFDDLGIRIPRAPSAWPETEGVARAAVNSFGFGGTNAHAVLEEWRNGAAPGAEKSEAAAAAPETVFVPLSANDPQALDEVARGLLDYVGRTPETTLPALARSALLHRAHHHHRLAVVARSLDELTSRLKTHLETGTGMGVVRGEAPFGDDVRPAWVFTGMGPQTWTMGQGLRRESPVFARSFERSLALFSDLAGEDLLRLLEKKKEDVETPGTSYAQRLNFALQVALCALLESWGKKPVAIVGHSVGELAGAHVAGVLDLESAVRIAHHRARLQHALEGSGTMLAVEWDEAALARLLSEVAPCCEIAAHNSKDSLAVAGPEQEIALLEEALEKQGAFARRLRVAVPYHSKVMDGIEQEFREAIGKVVSRAGSAALYSTVTGTLCDLPRDADYWWKNVREPVRFREAIEALTAAGTRFFLQIGPHPVLAPAIRNICAHSFHEAHVSCTLHRSEPEPEAVSRALAEAYVHGAPLDRARLAPAGRRLFDLPRYPWQRERHWQESEASRSRRLGPTGRVLLGIRQPAGLPLWSTALTQGYFDYLLDHRSANRALFPAAAYLEIGCALQQQLNSVEATRLGNLNFHGALILGEQLGAHLEIDFEPKTSVFSVRSRSGTSDSPSYQLHCTGTLSAHVPSPGKPRHAEPAADGYQRVDRDLYDLGGSDYFEYRARFQSMKALWIRGQDLIAELEMPAIEGATSKQYLIHPALLDGALQACVWAGHEILAGGNRDGVLMPIGIDEVELYASPGPKAKAIGRILRYDKTSIEATVDVYAEDGSHCASLRGITWAFLQTRRAPTTEDLRELTFLPTFQALEPVVTAETAPWVVVGSDARDTASLAAELARAGSNAVSVVEPLPAATDEPSLARLENLLSEAISADTVGLILLAPETPDDEPSAEDALDQATGVLAWLLALVRTGADARLKTALVTRNGQTLDPSQPTCPAHASLWGLGRAYGNEQRGPSFSLCDVGRTPTQADWSAFASRICQAELPAQWLVRDGSCYQLRLQHPKAPKDSGAASTRVSSDTPLTLDTEQRGSIEGLRWVQSRRRAPGAGEVELRVAASAINFKDLMKVMGLATASITRGSYLGEQLGMECSGVITRVGAGVTSVKVGDTVVAMTAGSFSTYVTCDERALSPPIPGLGLAETPVYSTFSTIVRALGDLAALSRGQTLLLHSAAGALGLAAIQYAGHLGARVFATAGTQEKRDYLARLPGVERVGDSRSLEFVGEVREWTEGRGVDVVLNFLKGELRHESLGLLAACGHFVDVGKPGGDPDAQLPARLFNTNMSFSNVDLDQLMQFAPERAKELAAKVREAFARGIFQALPTREIEPDDVQSAFGSMARAEHIGKLVVRLDAAEVSMASRKESLTFRADRSYLVTGAFGGFGAQVCRWLADHGAGTIVLASRRGSSAPEAKALVEDLAVRGTSAICIALDVANVSEVDQALTRIRAELPPLAGVFHAAMLLDDGAFTAMSRARLSTSLRPKALGAQNLHRATLGDPIEHFVLFSSIASLTGGMGQTNYAAANAFLDGLAQFRKARGLPALSINWGVLSDSGVVARNAELRRLLHASGVLGLSDAEALAGLGDLLGRADAQVGFLKLDWEGLASRDPEAIASPYLRELAHEARRSDLAVAPGLSRLLELLHENPESGAQALAEEAAGAVVAKVMRTTPQRLELRRPLRVAGADSLMATELSIAFLREYGVRLSTLDLLQTLSVADVAAKISERVLALREAPR